jgi:hypothetical protein
MAAFHVGTSQPSMSGLSRLYITLYMRDSAALRYARKRGTIPSVLKDRLTCGVFSWRHEPQFGRSAGCLGRDEYHRRCAVQCHKMAAKRISAQAVCDSGYQPFSREGEQVMASSEAISCTLFDDASSVTHTTRRRWKG